jgi:DNA invertase Pin-like site-specific DNA recombinase
MKSAYLYVRVSTDEQKRKGYSLPEQEDRLLKYCEYNDIKVEDVYREDFSAKNFNRPEWKKLIATIRKKPSEEEKNILFIKWDRFSRNIEYAYEMIGILRKYHTTAMSIDQQIDFSVPESTVMLAVYLSIPEAENSRRALNTSNGIRRAKQLGRYPNKAPMGFINLTALNGRKHIAPKQPEAGIIKWAFEQLSENFFKIDEVRRMACAKGLKCSRSHFVKLIRNPVYCGLIPLSIGPENKEMIKGIHDPLISEALFYEVQDIINTKRQVHFKTNEKNAAFFLKGHLICPVCGKKLRGSYSKGYSKNYPYYHCSNKCKVRGGAELLNECYNSKLQQFVLSKNAIGLFSLVLEDSNISVQRLAYLQKRKLMLRQLEEQDLVLSKARRLFVADQLKFDDYSDFKKEHQVVSGSLKKELDAISIKLQCIDQQFKLSERSPINIFGGFRDLDVADKKQLLNLISPLILNAKTGDISLKLHSALSKVLTKSI